MHAWSQATGHHDRLSVARETGALVGDQGSVPRTPLGLRKLDWKMSSTETSMADMTVLSF